MADSILRLKVESQEYDAKLRRATEGLTRYVDQCRRVGSTLEVVEKETLDYVRAIGQMETTSRSATGKLSEMKRSFTEFSMIYKQMSDTEKQSPVGKALSQSLDTLKSKINDTRTQLESVNRELSGSKFGQLGNIVDGLGQKLGINANITELLTSKTAMMTAGLGAATAIVGKATQEWAKYNAELAKQDQITTVTTGLKGPESDRMTNQARALTDTYGVDFREAINAANTLMTQFGQTGEQAMSLISDGMQGMIQGDGPKLLSMIQQYAPAFRDAGVSASQLVAVIQNSEGGIFTDQNMNAIVMGIKNIRLMTNATSEALGKLGIDGQKMSQQLRDGSMTIFDALKQVATQIQGVNSNSQAAGEVMQQVFGRQGAMDGTKLGEAIATLNTNLEETKRQTGELGDAYNDLYNANVKLNGAIRDCFEYDGWDQMATGIKAKLVSALASVLDYLGKIKGALGGFSVGQQQGDTRNGGGQFVDRAVDRLRGGNTPGKQQIYTRQIQAYSGKILDINDQIRQIQEKAAQDMDGNMAVVYKKQIRNLENRKQAIQRNMAEYDKRAQAVLNGTETTPAPVINPITNTTPKGGNSGKSVKTEEQLNNEEIQKLTQEYIKASDDRRKAIEGEIKTLQDRNKEIARLKDMALGKIGDDGSLPAMTQQLKDLQSAQSESANGREWDDYQKKIEDVTARINVLKGVLPKDQQATFTVEVNAGQLKQLRMLLPSDEETVRINVEEGRIDLPDIPTEIEQVVNTKVGDVVTPEIATDIVQTISTRLGSIVTPDIAETLTQVINTKVGDVVTPEIAKELTQVVNVETGTVNLPEIPKEDETIRVNITATTEDAMKEVRDMVGEIEGWDVTIEPKIEIDEQDLRTPFEKLQDSIRQELSDKNIEVDKNALKSLTEVVTQYDIKTGSIDMSAIMAQTEELTKNGMSDGESYAKALQDAVASNLDLSIIQQRIGKKIDIPDEMWQALQDNINEKLKKLGIEPIKIDFKTGKIVESGKTVEKSWQSAARAVQAVGSAMESIEDPAAKIAGTVAQAIANIALGYSQAMLKPKDPVSWIAFGAAGLVQMLAMMNAIHSSTGYANGGIVKGNSYSGDNIPAMIDGGAGGFAGLNAGEIVLNSAQQNNVAQNLQGSGRDVHVTGQISGENIILAANRTFKRKGQGEIVTW